MKTAVEGVLHNAKAGPLLLTDSGSAWTLDADVPEELFGKRVQATGEADTVVHDRPLVAEDGAYSAGQQGAENVLRHAVVEHR